MKEPYFVAAAAEYQKRLAPHVKLTVKELPEGHPVVNELPRDATLTVALCVDGQPCTSQQLAADIAAWQLSGISSVCYVIGGSDGLPGAVVQRADKRLSLSAMTFPHHLARVILLEQLYRAFQIIAGGKYHK